VDILGERLALEATYALLLFLWVIVVVRVISRLLYQELRRKGKPHNVAVYYARKFIHVMAGGLVALLVPYLFETPLLPLTLALVLALATYLPHRTGSLMYWFQVPENMFEVHFCIMWGLTITAAWLLLNDYWYGVLPVLFMAFGDAVTGIVRNAVYGRRTKAWVGNAAMAVVCVPLGWSVAGLAGALSGVVASFIEHFELGPLDDNITIPLSSLLVLLALRSL